MYKFVVVTDPDSAPGFRLAGADVFEASSLDEAKKIIPSLLYKDDMGIIAISEDLMPALDEKMQEKIDKAIKEAIILFIEKNHAVIGDMVRSSLDPGRVSDKQMVAEIEEKVGDDLQFIRLNGAVVGWFIGLFLGTVKALL